MNVRLNKEETLHSHSFHYTKKKFSIQVFFSKCDQIHRKLQICTRLKCDSKCITNTMKITVITNTMKITENKCCFIFKYLLLTNVQLLLSFAIMISCVLGYFLLQNKECKTLDQSMKFVQSQQ